MNVADLADADDLKELHRQKTRAHNTAERLRRGSSAALLQKVAPVDEESTQRLLAAVFIQKIARRKHAAVEVAQRLAELEAREKYERENMAAMKAEDAQEAALERLRSAEKKRKHLEHKMPGPFACLLCCCCRSAGGIADMLLNDTTREFALAVILGDGFADLTSVVAITLLRPLFSLMIRFFSDPEGIALEFQGDFIIVTWGSEGPGTVYSSALDAEDDGAIVMNGGVLLAGIITFVITLYGTYVIFKACSSDRTEPPCVAHALAVALLTTKRRIAPQLLGKLKAFTETMTSSEEKDAAESVAGGAGPNAVHPLKSNGSSGRKQLSRFEYKERVTSSAVVLTVNSVMHVVGVSACNLPQDLVRRYLDGRLGVFLPTVLAELSTEGFVLITATQFQANMVYTLNRTPGVLPAPPRMPRKPPAHRKPPAPPFKSETVTVL